MQRIEFIAFDRWCNIARWKGNMRIQWTSIELFAEKKTYAQLNWL